MFRIVGIALVGLMVAGMVYADERTDLGAGGKNLGRSKHLSNGPPDIDAMRAGCGKGRALTRHFLGEKRKSSSDWIAGLAVQVDGTGTAESLEHTDVLHYQLDIEISDIDTVSETCLITGSNRMTIRSLSPYLTHFTFRLQDHYTITDALLNDLTPATLATQSLTTRVVTLDRPYGIGEEFTLTIEYTGIPDPPPYDAIVVREEDGVPLVATSNQPWWAYTWWPAKDGDIEQPGDLSDKATMDFSITVPDNFDVPSNGLLQSVDIPGDGRARYNWSSSYPNTAYGVALAVSEYNRWTEYYVHDTGSMPVEFYIFEAYDNQTNRDAWSEVVDMIGVFSDLFGEYPFIDEKYGIFESSSWFGATEYQTMTSQGGGDWAFNDWLTAHELAHSWWGNLVTCKTWSDIWLNEGPAKHSECLWEEFKTGTPDQSAYLSCMLDRKPTGAGAGASVYVPRDELFDWRIFSYDYTYLKGAWVMHQLRGVVGDTVFFDILSNWRAAYAFSAATTADFAAIASTAYGSNLRWFFDQWVYNAGAPAYAYTWETENVGGQDYLHVWIGQVQNPPNPEVFVMPVDLVVTIGGSPETLTVWNDARVQAYSVAVSGPVTDLQFDPNEWILRTFAVEGDCNHNSIRDACDVDCDAGGCSPPPHCGGSQDCNENRIPDECEPDEDCNLNSIPDICDIFTGTSDDCNGNAVPDSCETDEDCNSNGMQDICDIFDGTSNDCNTNDVPDECESLEDCNSNATQDICDIAFRTSIDCNANNTPDECEVGADCNENTIPDECDIADYTSPDCNGNAIPDECDLANGLPDNNGDGIPDECEPLPPALPPAPHDAPKNRYISVDLTPNGNTIFAYKVEIVEMKRCLGDYRRACSVDAHCPNVCNNNEDITCLSDAACEGGTCVPTVPCLHHFSEGSSWWLQDPQREPLGCRPPGACTDEDWFARLDATPHFRAWDEFGDVDSTVLHISGCAITPVATYAVSACATPTGDVCGEPLIIGTISKPDRNYGDVVGVVDPATNEFTPPNGIVNVTDVSGYLLTNANWADASGLPKPQAHWTWFDLHGEGPPNYRPQGILSVGDLSEILFGIEGDPFAASGGNVDPSGCP
ncbi:MAG: M1 family metallopeptidase [Phycisphaerales bacterium]|nr:MAG: M1 family metallopeptidase [Phycisphaerales bacterium]